MTATLDEECVQEEETCERVEGSHSAQSLPTHRGVRQTDDVYLTFQGQPVVLHATCHVLAYYPLHIIQGLWGQGMAEAGLLPPVRKGSGQSAAPDYSLTRAARVLGQDHTWKALSSPSLSA